MSAKGLYRTVTPESGAEYAYLDYGVPSNPGEMRRARYESNAYEPPFDSLPTKQQYEAANAHRT